ncbi:type VII secretion protein, partial [Listeria monocytogenes]|nr:type VII secretion protein [Listeria monocytogenes]
YFINSIPLKKLSTLLVYIQVSPDGVLRDPNTGEVINWKPGEPRTGKADFGHLEGKTYKDEFKKYKNREITLEQLKEFQFDPKNYRIESPSVNRSHKYE